MESSKGEQASVVFLGRDTFRMRVVSEAVEEDGAIPTALAEGQTGRIFDRRRVPRTARGAEARGAEEIVPARAPRIPLFMLLTTVAAALFVAAAVFVVRPHATASVAAPAPAPAPAPVMVTPPAPIVPAPLDEPTPAAMAAPVGSPAPVVPAPLDEPTPASMAAAPQIEGPSPEASPRVAAPAVERPTAARPAARPATRRSVRTRTAPAKRILPPSRPWVDPFAG